MIGKTTTQDKLIACVDCGAQFTFSARDQSFYLERGYQEPRRCKTCRNKRKTTQIGGARPQWPGAEETGHAPGPEMPPPSPQANQFKVSCSACGAEATVPFKPNPNRPVYCRTCFLDRRGR